MKHLYFVRHGQTEWNAIARMQGQWNSNLNERGRGHAELNGQLLKTLDIDSLFVSPLDRTRQTAEIINQHLQLDPTFDERIMEWDCGDWSGEMYADIRVKWEAEWQALEADRFNYRAPNGENYPDMFARSIPFVEELLTTDHQNIAVVSHGMIGKVMVAHLMGYDPAQTLAIHQDNDLVFRVSIEGDTKDIAFFSAGKGPNPGLPERG